MENPYENMGALEAQLSRDGRAPMDAGRTGLDAKLGRLSLGAIAADEMSSNKKRETSPQYSENKVRDGLNKLLT